MANITLGGNAITTNGTVPATGTSAPSFTLKSVELKDISLNDFKGRKLILNIFPSVDTGVCAASVRHFNEKAAQLENTTVLCISRDLPFAQARFCGAEGIENVVMLSDFQTGKFGKDYGLEIESGAFANLHSRVIIVVDEEGNIIYTEQVPEIGQDPDFEVALATV